MLPTLVEGAKAVQLADLAYRSVAERRWMTCRNFTCRRFQGGGSSGRCWHAGAGHETARANSAPGRAYELEPRRMIRMPIEAARSLGQQQGCDDHQGDDLPVVPNPPKA